MDFGQTVINLLEKNNMSQRTLAQRLKIAPTTLNGYIRNKHEPDYVTLIAIADIFGVSADYLLGHKTKEKPAEKILAKKFSALDSSQQELVLGMIELMLRQNEKKNTK